MRRLLTNRIKDIKDILESGVEGPEKTPITRTPREEDLIMERDALQEKLNEVRAEARPVRSEADVAADKAQQAVDRAAAALDRQQRINSGEITPEAKEKVQPLSDLEKELRDRTEELKKAKRDAESYRSPEDLAAEAAQKGVDRAAAALDRWDQILKGDIVPEGKTPKEAMTDLQEEMQSQIEAMKAAHRELERKTKPESEKEAAKEKQQLKALEKAIAEYERRAREVDLEPKPKTGKPDSAQIAKAKQARDAARKVVEEMRKARKTVKTPEEQYNERGCGKQVEKMIAEAERKLGDQGLRSEAQGPTDGADCGGCQVRGRSCASSGWTLRTTSNRNCLRRSGPGASNGSRDFEQTRDRFEGRGPRDRGHDYSRGRVALAT